jgi:hypothetical protein
MAKAEKKQCETKRHSLEDIWIFEYSISNLSLSHLVPFCIWNIGAKFFLFIYLFIAFLQSTQDT